MLPPPWTWPSGRASCGRCSWWASRTKAEGRLEFQPKLRGGLYLTSADEDNIAPPASRLAETLRKHAPAGLKWEYEPRPDLRHDNIHRSLSPRVLRRWFAEPAAAGRPPIQGGKESRTR